MTAPGYITPPDMPVRSARVETTYRDGTQSLIVEHHLDDGDLLVMTARRDHAGADWSDLTAALPA